MPDYKLVLEEENQNRLRLYTKNLNDAVTYARDVVDTDHKLVTGRVDDKAAAALIGKKRQVYILEK